MVVQMKKHSIVKTFTSALLLFFFFILIGCNENSEMINDPSNNLSASGDYYILGIEDGMSSIEDATLEKDMGFATYFNSRKFPPRGDFGFGRDRHHRGFFGGFKGRGLHLGFLFYKLDISDDQKGAIKTLMEGNRECLVEPFEKFREAAKEIMEGTKEQMQSIRDMVKAGTLTREEARKLIKKQNEATREEIENCEACIEARDAMCACNTTLFESIGAEIELTEEQLVIYNEWLTKHPRPCPGG